MITKTPAYQYTDGTTHTTIEAAQTHELETLFSAAPADSLNGPKPCAKFVAEFAREFLTILKSTGCKPREKKAKTKAAPKTKAPAHPWKPAEKEVVA